MAFTTAALGAVAAAASTAAAVKGMTSKGGGGQVAKPPDLAALGRTAIPGAKADAAARVGGGMSPDFLANLVGQQTGEPQAGLDVLGDIRRELGQSP